MEKLSVTELCRIDSDQFKASKKLPVTVILDNVRSIYNVGSVFRTSDAFRIEKIILCGITCTPDNSLVEIHKTALGAEETVEWSYSQNCLNTVLELKNKGYRTIAVEQVRDSYKLDSYIPVNTEKYALIFGNEVKGVSQEIVDICDASLEIPQFGTKHSLNVSVSAGIVLWEFLKAFEKALD